ncbi:MAG TPA: major capsid protein [Methylophilaceae bacterium]|nr:major capsid protein [Methylophilaceae bacterium]
MSLSVSQTRVINPILSNVAQGYGNQDLVGMSLFPRVPVAVSGGQIIEFDRDAFRLVNARRAPGAGTRRLQLGYSGKPFALLQDSLEVPVPREYSRDALAVPAIDMAARSVRVTMRNLTLNLENDQAILATTAANYGAGNKVTLAGATKWSTATGTPLTDIDTAREAIRQSCGVYPNVLVLSALAFNACKNNPSVIARVQYNANVAVDATSITPAILAGLFNVKKVVIGAAVSWTDANVAADIWGNNAVLAYVPEEDLAMETPSFGYTYTMDGNPLVEEPYYDNNAKSWIYGVTYERVPVLSGITSGYLIQNPS